MKKITPLFFFLIPAFLFFGCTKDRVPDPSTLNLPQETIYNENFDESAFVSPGFPTGWNNSNGGLWKSDSSNFSTNYSGASGSRNVKVSNDSLLSTIDTLFSSTIPTLNYNGISVIYGVRRSTHFSDNGSGITSFAYSIDGGIFWTNLPFTESTGDSNWYLINTGVRIKLPDNSANQSGVRFRWIAKTFPTPSGTYRIDDFQVFGTHM